MIVPRIVTVSSSDYVEPVSLLEAKAWLKLEEEDTDENALIEQLITTARQRYEAYTNRVLVKTAFDQYQDDLCSHEIRPRKFPLASVTSIKGFTDTDATDTGGTSMNSSEYYVDTASEPGRIVALQGYTFPVGTRRVNAYITRFVAGYSTSSTGVPSDAKTTLCKMIAKASEFRGDESQRDAAMDEVLYDEFSSPDWG